MMNAITRTILVALCATVIPARFGHATKASLVADECKYNTYMCCWTKNDNGVEDNTDVCEVTKKNGRVVQYKDNSEGKVHCHGMVWAEGASYESFILPLYKYVRTFDHRDARGYYGRMKGAPQCECIEKMPKVSRADCTTYSAQGLVACEDNDLRTHYDNVMEKPGRKLSENLVDCQN